MRALERYRPDAHGEPRRHAGSRPFIAPSSEIDLDDVDEADRGVAAWMRPATCVRQTALVASIEVLLASLDVAAVPIVDEQGRLVGIVTRADLLAARSGDTCARTASDVMMSFPFALPLAATIDQAAALMAYEGVGQLVIVTEGGVVVGLVRALDIARRVADHA